MLTLTYPTNVQLDRLLQEYVVDLSDLVGLNEFAPIIGFDYQEVRWDELDSDFGMTAPHGMDSDPRIDKRPGSKTRSYEPIPFKESDVIKESELLKARQLGTLGGVVSIDTLVARVMKSRADKTKIRAEWCVWQMAQGLLDIEENGVKVTEAFPVQTFDTQVAWDQYATATPLKDIQDAAMQFRGPTGATGEGAFAYVNRKTLNDVLNNKNDDDLWGFRSQNFLALTFSTKEVNSIFEARGLPTLRLYDGGYVDKNKQFQFFIPDDVVIIKGKRQLNQVVANFATTPTLHRKKKDGNMDNGFFSILEINGRPNTGSSSVNLNDLGEAANPNIKHTGGVYGGPVCWYPRSIIKMDVS